MITEIRDSHAFDLLRKARWFLLTLILLAIALGACGGDAKRAANVTQSATTTGVTTAQLEAVPDGPEAPGTVRAVKSAEVAARVMGTVTNVAVREGDSVAAGQLLAQIDDREFGARRAAAQAAVKEALTARDEAAQGLAAAEANAALAKKTYDRFVYLREQKSVSPQEFDEVEAKYRAATAGLEQAKARQRQVEAAGDRAQSEARAADAVSGYTRVTAPFSGVVVRRLAEAGQMAAPGQPLFVVEDASRYELEASVDARALTRGLRRGTKARVTLDALPGTELEGSVSELESGAESASQTLRVRIALPQTAGVHSGLFGRARFCCSERQALAVPRSALVQRGQLTGIYVLDKENVARLRIVTLGGAFGEKVEVLSGLEAGERYVTQPRGELLEGQKVSATP